MRRQLRSSLDIVIESVGVGGGVLLQALNSSIMNYFNFGFLPKLALLISLNEHNRTCIHMPAMHAIVNSSDN